MRKSVEHLGPQHALVSLLVDENTILRVCPDFELRRFAFMQDFLRAYGRVFTDRPFDDKYPRMPLGGRCYDQAAYVAEEVGLVYCEGVMLIQLPNDLLFPLPHGWCCTMGGEVVDPTCHKLQGSPRVKYYGVPILPAYVREWKDKYGFHGMLDGHPDFGDQVGVYADNPMVWLHRAVRA